MESGQEREIEKELENCIQCQKQLAKKNCRLYNMENNLYREGGGPGVSPPP